jgi:methylglutaconyl-CoA hydratase
MMLDAPKPIIGRIDGHCLGGGVGLAAACDISIASDSVEFGFTEVRLGVAPAVIAVVCLPKLTRADALELFLSGERVSAGRAADVGLISRSVPARALDAAIADALNAIRRGGPAALAAVKEIVRQVPAMSRDEAFEWASLLSVSLFSSTEAAEGIAAFREKRAARWTR